MDLTQIVLASASPRRHYLFKQIGLSPTIRISGVDEEINSGLSVEDIVQQIATRKGVSCTGQDLDTLVIAADTVVYFRNRIFGKPVDENEAVSMLKELSGNTHSVYTGVSLIDTNLYQNDRENSVYTFCEQTKVTFASLTEKEINNYVATGSPMDKAGAYGIQDDLGSLFVRRIEGDYYNVVGFPLHSFYSHLKIFMPELADNLFQR